MPMREGEKTSRLPVRPENGAEAMGGTPELKIRGDPPATSVADLQN